MTDTPERTGSIPFPLLSNSLLCLHFPLMFSFLFLSLRRLIAILHVLLWLVGFCFLLRMFSFSVSFSTIVYNSLSLGWFRPISSLQHLTYIEPSFKVSPLSFPEYWLGRFPFPSGFSLDECSLLHLCSAFLTYKGQNSSKSFSSLGPV